MIDNNSNHYKSSYDHGNKQSTNPSPGLNLDIPLEFADFESTFPALADYQSGVFDFDIEDVYNPYGRQSMNLFDDHQSADCQDLEASPTTDKSTSITSAEGNDYTETLLSNINLRNSNAGHFGGYNNQSQFDDLSSDKLPHFEDEHRLLSNLLIDQVDSFAQIRQTPDQQLDFRQQYPLPQLEPCPSFDIPLFNYPDPTLPQIFPHDNCLSPNKCMNFSESLDIPTKQGHQASRTKRRIDSNCGSSPHRLAYNPPRERSEKDNFLLRLKAKGLSYKEIKVVGNFSEAESTLRGRYRMLTKPKEQRVRKPEWSENDLNLLKTIVRQHLVKRLGHDEESYQSVLKPHYSTLNKISWKQVAERMADHGCYRYGNATVKKKYLEIMGFQAQEW